MASVTSGVMTPRFSARNEAEGMFFGVKQRTLPTAHLSDAFLSGPVAERDCPVGKESAEMVNPDEVEHGAAVLQALYPP